MKHIFLKITFVLVTSISFSQAPTNGLVASYLFNGNANDESGNGNNGVVNGATLTTDRFGKANSAYSFDGINDYIKAPIGNLPALSVSLWINSSYPVQFYPQIVHYGNYEFMMMTGNNPSYVSNRIEGSIYSGYFPSTPRMIGGDKISFDEWHHLVVVFENTTKTHKLYIDGNLSKSGVTTGVLMSETTEITIGNTTNGKQSDGGAGVKGIIDDIRCYNRGLTESEVTALHNENICFKTVSVTDTLRISSVAGINSLPESFGSIKVYPNPAHDILNINISKSSTDYSIKIVDNMGKTVYTSAMTSNNLQINLSQFTAKGLYLIQILDNSNKVLDVKKLVLE